MQQEAFANTEDLGGPESSPDRHGPRGRAAMRPMRSIELGAAYDEMFAPDGRPRPPYAALDSPPLHACRWRN